MTSNSLLQVVDTAEICLTRGHVTIIDANDYEELSSYKWHSAKCGSGKIYAARSVISGGSIKRIYMHQQIAGADCSKVVDHLNGDSLDNRRSNLRLVSIAQNNENNRVIRSASGFRGVFAQGKKFVAKIKRNGATVYLGSFDTDIEAAFQVNLALDESRNGIGARNEIDFERLIFVLEEKKAGIDFLLSRAIAESSK